MQFKLNTSIWSTYYVLMKFLEVLSKSTHIVIFKPDKDVRTLDGLKI